MISSAFHLAAWTVVFFIIGMIRPRWPLFFMKKPDRFLIFVITVILGMISVTLWGEGHKRKEMEMKLLTPKATIAPADAPLPNPITEQPKAK